MGTPGQHATDEKMVNQLQTFVKVGEQSGVFASPGSKALRQDHLGYLRKMIVALDPASVPAQHKTKIAPQLLVLNNSHDMVASL